MKKTKWTAVIVALAIIGLALGSACAPTPHADSVAVTYYYMPG